jgi:hypothetical protein
MLMCLFDAANESSEHILRFLYFDPAVLITEHSARLIAIPGTAQAHRSTGHLSAVSNALMVPTLLYKYCLTNSLQWKAQHSATLYKSQFRAAQGRPNYSIKYSLVNVSVITLTVTDICYRGRNGSQTVKTARHRPQKRETLNVPAHGHHIVCNDLNSCASGVWGRPWTKICHVGHAVTSADTRCIITRIQGRKPQITLHRSLESSVVGTTLAIMEPFIEQGR